MALYCPILIFRLSCCLEMLYAHVAVDVYMCGTYISNYGTSRFSTFFFFAVFLVDMLFSSVVYI